VYFFCFVLGLVPTSYVEVLCLRDKLCTPSVEFNSSVEVPLWKVLCGQSENLSVRRRGRRAVLKPRNISQCLRLIHYISTLSLFISCIALHCSYYIRAWYWLCAHTCVEPREFL